MEGSWAIEARGLFKNFGRRAVLEDISFELSRGEFLGIFGPNGAGKTTLLKILSTLLKPTSGEVIIEGKNLDEDSISIRNDISLLSHSSFLYKDLSAYENLRFYGKMFGIGNIDKRISELLELVELETRRYDLVSSFSRGMEQRLAIARSLLHRPSVIFLDEPYNGLDAHAAGILDSILEKLRNENCTFILTTHDLKKGLELVSSIMILSRGKIRFKEERKSINDKDFLKIYGDYVKEHL